MNQLQGAKFEDNSWVFTWQIFTELKERFGDLYEKRQYFWWILLGNISNTLNKHIYSRKHGGGSSKFLNCYLLKHLSPLFERFPLFSMKHFHVFFKQLSIIMASENTAASLCCLRPEFFSHLIFHIYSFKLQRSKTFFCKIAPCLWNSKMFLFIYLPS